MTEPSPAVLETIPERPRRRGALGTLQIFAERRTLVMLALGFAAGLPNLLIFDTLSAWLRTAGLSLETIAFFGLATLSYSLKFIWAPVLDRTSLPIISRRFGHRRSWMLVAQCFVIIGLWLIAASTPGLNLWPVAGAAVLVGFAGATQDIVIDAWRIEVVDESRQGAMAAAYQWGYRFAVIAAGAVPLVLAQRYNWNISYGVMAALMSVGVLAVLFAPREKQHSIRPIHLGDLQPRPWLELTEWLFRGGLIALAALVIGSGLTGKPDLLVTIGRTVGAADSALRDLATAWTSKSAGVFIQFLAVIAGLGLLVVTCRPFPGLKSRPGAYLQGSFGLPLKDFFDRFGNMAGFILALICLYRLADFVLNIMNPFYLDLGFSMTEIAEVRKLFGIVSTMLGVFAGGWSVARLGLMRTLLIGAFASPLSHLMFAWLATQGPDMSALFIAIGVENFATGYAGTALIAYMSSLTSAGFTATQYALFSSLYALPGKLIASQSGRIIDASARAAETGLWAFLKPLFASLPPQSMAKGAATLGVAPAALGAGYFVFFIYSTVIGVFAIILAFIVASGQRRARQPAGVVAASSGRS